MHAEMEKLVEQEIRCRIIKLDATEEDVVVDRRAIAEEEEQLAKGRRYSELKEGDTVSGTVRSLTDYGAFVDIGGVDALAARRRYFLEPGEQSLRCLFRGTADRSHGSEDRSGKAAHFAWG